MPPQFENKIPPTENPVQPEAPHKHTQLILLTVAMILVGILAVGYFVYQNQQISAPVETQNITVATTTDEFADWQTYRNEEYGFEIKYPEDWKIQNTDEVGKNGLVLKLYKEYKISGGINPGSLRGVCQFELFTDTTKKSGESMKEWKYRVVDVNLGPNQFSTSTEITYTSIKGIYDKTNTEEGGILDSVFLPLSDTNILAVHFYCGDDVREEGRVKLNQILSTFKFISTSTPMIIDASNWKTYRNEEYGFEFKYPSNNTTSVEDLRSNGPNSEYMRIQNFTGNDYQLSLKPEEYYIELYMYDSTNDCKSVGDLSVQSKIVDLGVVSGYRFNPYDSFAGGGILFSICVSKNGKEYLFNITENNEQGEIANKILDTLKFTK